MPDQPLDRRPEDHDGSSSRAAARRMAAAHRRGERHGQERAAVAPERHPSATASADTVDALRRSVRDLKHDVRMLKVVVDKQSALLERLLGRLQER